MKLKFTKMHGLGNDFVVIDNISNKINLTTKQIKYLANRNFGIGFDQLLFIEAANNTDIKNNHCDFHYRIFNADGSEAEQCGNGVRCVARYLIENNLSNKNPLKLSSKSGFMEVTLDYSKSDHIFDYITVNMGEPILTPSEIPFNRPKQEKSYQLNLFENEQELMVVSMGNPHAIIITDNIQQAPVSTLGPRIAKHPDFPESVNVEFIQIIDPAKIALRVFERGAGETLACGSGACAAVVAGILNDMLDNRVEVELLGGKLIIEWQGIGHPVYMTGAAVSVFNGTIKL